MDGQHDALCILCCASMSMQQEGQWWPVENECACGPLQLPSVGTAVYHSDWCFAWWVFWLSVRAATSSAKALLQPAPYVVVVVLIDA